MTYREFAKTKPRELDVPALSRQAYDVYFQDTLAEFHGVIARVVSSYEMIKALQEELYQEISVALWKALSKFDNQSSLKTYVLSIAHKRAISHVAKYAREPRTVDISNFEFQSKDSPSKNMMISQRMTRLLNALAQLTLIERQLVTLALEGVRYKEIAEILGITTNLVGVKLSRAKTKLKNLMLEEESA